MTAKAAIISLMLASAMPFALAWPIGCSAQTAKQDNQKEVNLFINSNLEKEFNTTKERSLKYLEENLDSLQTLGFLESRLDSISSENKSISYFLSSGPAYTHQLFGTEQASLAKMPKEGKVDHKSLLNYLDLELDRLENSGYPFAKVQIDVLDVADKSLQSRLQVIKGPLVILDSIAIISDDDIHFNSIRHFLSAKTGQPYSEEKLQVADAELNALSFLQTTRKSQVAFYEEGAVLYLYIKRKRSGFVNGIVGILPDATTQRVLITGELDLRLQNSFNRSETLGLRWRKLQDQTQDFDVSFVYPFIAGKPLGVDSRLNIYRRDSSFTSLESSLGLHVQLSSTSYIKAFAEFERNNAIRPNATLGTTGDAEKNNYGLQLGTAKNFFPLNPRQGYALTVKGSAGRREVFSAENAEVAGSQFQLEWQAAAAQPIAGQLIAYAKLEQSAIWTDSPLFLNELNRIGGLKRLRGFDEESIFADRYILGTAEIRYRYSERGYFAVFADQAWLSTRTVDQLGTDTPIGFGAGLQIDTKAGVFAISYALGRQQNNPVLLGNGKVHFGFVSTF